MAGLATGTRADGWLAGGAARTPSSPGSSKDERC